MIRKTENRNSELRLQEELPAPAPAPAPAQAPAEPPTEEPAGPIVLEQFKGEECIVGAMEDGETFGSMELEPGVTGITCRRVPDGPTEVQALNFDPTTFDEAAAQAWAQSNEFLAWSRKVAGRHALLECKRPRVHSHGFQDMPGTPEDPEAPKLDEGMESFRSEVLKAIDAKGWSYFVSMEPDYDFVLEELWPDRILVLDTLTGCYHSILVTKNEDGSVALGEPTKVDITISTKEGEPEVAPVAAASTPKSPVLRNTGTQALVASRQGGEPGKGTPLYRVLLCQGGWTKDQRYITDDCLREAVSLGKFDGAKCFYGHPEPQADGRRSRLAVGFVKPGSVQVEENKAGHVDVWGDIALMRSTGAEIMEFLDQSLEIGVPLLGASVYCRETDTHFGTIDGRQAQVFTKLRSEKVNVDFVDDPAFPRAVATEKLAANRQKTGDPLTMDERQRLDSAEKRVKELEAESALRKRETVVNAELAATGWPVEFIAAQKPVLLEIEKPAVRQAHIATMNMILGKKAGVTTGATGGPTDSAGADSSRLSAEMQAQLAKIAKARGWKPEVLANAEATAFGR